MEEAVRNQETEKITESLLELKQLSELEKIINDNSIEFLHNGKIYRVRLPSWNEQDEVTKKKISQYQKMLTETDDNGNLIYKFKKEWINIYKKQGVDFDSLDEKYIMLQAQIEEAMINLAQTVDDPEIKRWKDEISDLKQKQLDILVDKSDKLQYALEDQLAAYVNSYTTYIVLEEKIEDKWQRLFKTYNDFKNTSDCKLIAKAVGNLEYIIYNERN